MFAIFIQPKLLFNQLHFEHLLKSLNFMLSPFHGNQKLYALCFDKDCTQIHLDLEVYEYGTSCSFR